MKTLIPLLLLVSAAAPLPAGEVTIVLPPETATFKPALGIELAQAHCLICHSADYPNVQAALPKKFWEGTVKKMREKYGAPVPEEAVAPLVEYLARAYAAPEPAR